MKMLLNNINFRNYFIGVLISNIGDYMDDIAMAQIIYLITKSTFITSYVFAIKIICSLISIFTSTVVDLGNKKRLLSSSCILQAFVILTLIISFRTKTLSIFILIVLVTMQALFSTFMKPCQNAILPRIVGKNDIIEARSLIEIANQFLQIFSYFSAGIIVMQIGLTGALIIDFLSFMVMPILLLFVNFKDVTIKGDKNYINEMKDGLKFIADNKLLKDVMLLTFIGNFLVAPVDSLIVALISSRNYRPDTYALYMTSLALGGIITGLLYKKINLHLSPKHVLAVGYLYGMVSLIVLCIQNLFLMYFSGFLMGISTYIVSVMNASLIQIYTPVDKSARTFSIFKCLSFLASPLGIVIAGALGEYMNLGYVFAIYGLLMSAAVLGSFLLEKTPIPAQNN